MDVNRTPKPFLDFDDVGASDDEPAKGITIGDIRAWHDQYDMLLSSWAECREVLTRERGAICRVATLLDEQKYLNDVLTVAKIRRALEKKMSEQSEGHQPWCAKMIAANAELPWTVRCDCKPRKKRKPAPAEPYREIGWLGGFDVEGIK